MGTLPRQFVNHARARVPKLRLFIRPGLSGSNARHDTGEDTSATLGSASEWIPIKRSTATFVAKQDGLVSLRKWLISLCIPLIHHTESDALFQ